MRMHPLAALVAATFIGACTGPNVSEQIQSSETVETGITTLRPGVLIHASYRDAGRFGRVLSNGLVVTTGSEAVLINTAWGEDPDESTAHVLRVAAQQMGVPVRRAILTHFHDDSVAGIATLRQEGIRSYTIDLTAELMEGEGWMRPDSLLNSSTAETWTLTSENVEVEVFFAGPGHTADNVVVYIPHARVLFGGCLIRPGESTTLGNTADADVGRWAESVARVRERYAGLVDIVVPTHGAAGGPELLDHTIRLVEAHRQEQNR